MSLQNVTLSEPPTSVELILEDDNVSEDDGGSTSSTTSTALYGGGGSASLSTSSSASSSSELHVSFALLPQVVEIDSIRSQDERERLWYNDSDYIVMMQDAGVQRKGGIAGKQGQSRNRSASPSIQWAIRSLWLGSLVMGFLATTCTRRPK
jgi:hypothetical protein